MPNRKVKKQTGYKCPKCGAKLQVDEFGQKCKRCGYFKSTEPSNFTKRMMGW